MITLTGSDGSANKYIESQNIRVFPCAYRGYYNATSTETFVFDPEARATTEANFTNAFHKLSNKKASYVVSWVPDTGKETGTLKCVIGGYYFEIYNYSMQDFFYEDNDTQKPYYLCIKTTSINLGTSEPDESDVRTTEVLSSFANTSNYLDIKQNNNYAFTGLLISESEAGTASLAPFTVGTSYIEDHKASNTTEADKTAQINKYYLNDSNQLIKIQSIADVVQNGTQLYSKSESYSLDQTKIVVTDVLDVGSGKYSIRMLEDITEQGLNTTIASGDYSISLGKQTVASNEASTALGNTTTASGKGAFTAGNNTIASGEGAVALGNNTTASGDGAATLGSNLVAESENQVVIGKYNTSDTTQAFIIANGATASDATANKFTVSYNGDVKAQGTLTAGPLKINGDAEVNGAMEVKSTLVTKGDITASGPNSNSLVLGTDVNGSYGSIVVYGEKTTPVFQVSKKGNLQLTGKVEAAETKAVDNSTTLTTKGYVEDFVEQKINTKLEGKADSTTVATNLSSAIEDAKTELKNYNNTVIATEIAKAKTELLKSVSDDFAARDTAETPPTAATQGTGKYIQSVSQTNGQITAVEGAFVSSISRNNTTDAPTPAAVHIHVATEVSKVWTSSVVAPETGKAIRKSLQEIILDAAYPVGSIYTYYSSENVSTCPIETSLGGTWEMIPAGTFLCAAESDADSIYNREKTGGFEETQLKAHYHELERNSDYSGGKNTKTKVTTAENGAHTHQLNILARAHDASTDNGLRSGKTEPNGCHQWTFTYTTESAGSHTHSVDLTGIKTASAGTDISTVKGTNLPPYLAVYMWRRIPDPT